MSTEPDPPATRSWLRLANRLRLEDVALFAWLVLRPLVVPAASAAGSVGADPLGGLFDLVALGGAAAALTARRLDRTDSGLFANGDVQYAVGPLFGALALAVVDAQTRLGLADEIGPLPLVVPIVAAVVARLWLPPTTAPVRRALVTPFLLATSGFFSDFLGRLTDLFDLRTFTSAIGTPDAGPSLVVAGFGVLGLLIFYTMLIFAPRQIAEREGTTATWAARFVVFLVGLVLGTTLAGVVHGS